MAGCTAQQGTAIATMPCVNRINTPSFRSSPLSSADTALPKHNSLVVGSTSSAALRDTQNVARKTEQAFPSV